MYVWMDLRLINILSHVLTMFIRFWEATKALLCGSRDRKQHFQYCPSVVVAFLVD